MPACEGQRRRQDVLVVGHAPPAVVLVIVWHLLANNQTYTDLGADYYTHRDNPEARKHRLLRQLHDLGYQADLTPLAA
ncbi:hypothetical protein [Micromonospora sp. MA102]|uniref:hypothetical protein n=1 Tax=Micromonospora sp. MA102 TaxID=2952755 RepID=UPI0021C9A5DA|nr:hypothetical protein [Micromonospora sp. MA102]